MKLFVRTGNERLHPDSPDFPPWLKARQVEELAELDATYKTGQDRVTMGEAHVAAILANANKRPDMSPFKPGDFMPRRLVRQTAEEQKQTFFRSGTV